MAIAATVGATSWGTTLSIILAREGHDVRLLARTDEEARLLESARENSRFVPGFHFPDGMRVESDPERALEGADLVIFAVPSQTLRVNVRHVVGAIPLGAITMSAAKGIELGSGCRMSEILADELPAQLVERICALSGPNLANEIVEGLPSSSVIASANATAALEAQRIVNSSVFRVYTNSDVIGVELCGALKNVIALGAGICDGLGFGDNAKSAFITRGLAEITRLGVAAGAKAATFAGLAGMGDLIATCSSALSRNHYVGSKLAAGWTLSDIRRDMHNVAEGVYTTRAALDMARPLGVEMPITQAIRGILFEDVPVAQTVQDLMGRNPRWE